MATRPNPYYSQGFANPGMAQIANTLAAIFAQPAAQEDPSLAYQRTMSGNQSAAQAGKYQAETAGIVSKNAAMDSAPKMLAELFMNGGKFQDDPIHLNPNYQPAPPVDYSLTASGVQDQPISSMFYPSNSAADKMGMAIQEALIRGVKLDDIGKFAGQGGYLSNVNAGTPDAGMPYMPLFGETPTTSTALTTGRQDAMSARDATEALTQATSVAGIQGDNSARVANINQAGQDRRKKWDLAADAEGGGGSGTGGVKPSAVPAVTPTIAKAIHGEIATQATNLGLPQLDPAAQDFLATEATKLYQTPGVQGFKNVQESVLAVLDKLAAGEMTGVETTEERVPSWWRPESMEAKKPVVKRSAATAKTEDPNIAAARAAIARGAPRDAVIKRLKDNGIDPKGL